LSRSAQRSVGQSAAHDAPNLAPPPGNPRFPLFDGLRAIAALSVFAGHTITVQYSLGGHPTAFVWATNLADQGVAIFFLISGFLLYRPFLSARSRGVSPSLGDYFRRRFLRIVPAYWLALSLFIALGFVSGITTSNWWVFYGFAQIYDAHKIGHGIGVAWTLCIEVSFYIALPIFALALSRLSARSKGLLADAVALALLAAGSLAFRATHSSFFESATVSTLWGTFFWFALGMGLALISVSVEGQPTRARFTRWVGNASAWCWLAAAALWVLLHEIEVKASSLSVALRSTTLHVMYGLVALLVLLPAVFEAQAGGLARRVLRAPPLLWVGLVSYAFYLYHTTVLEQLSRRLHLGAARYPVVTAVALLVSCACAAASYYLLERPAMRLGRRRSRHEFARAPQPAAVQDEPRGDGERLEAVDHPTA
jgi:peptidoglycan/LPS O-acetylase OafA/YrhL